MHFPQHSPVISIGIPAYNRAAGVEKAVRSVLSQEYPHLEIILSDNGSTDETEAVCRRLASEDDRIRYFRQPRNQGPTANFRFVLQHSTGDYFMWLADDDWLEEGILARYVDFLENHPDHVLVTGDIVYWKGGEVVYQETDFSFQQEAPKERVAEFFRKVFVGGLFHSLFRADLARRTPVKNAIGFDWFFAARMLLRGKAMNLPQAGYHKSCLGLSRCHVNFARVIGASRFAAYNPYLNTCYHIASEMLLTRSSPYRRLPFLVRVDLTLRCAYFVIRTFYLKRFRSHPMECARESARALAQGLFSRDYHEPRRGQTA
jgi:glycosyltransferase involved in cell wall biosynthesis